MATLRSICLLSMDREITSKQLSGLTHVELLKVCHGLLNHIIVQGLPVNNSGTNTVDKAPQVNSTDVHQFINVDEYQKKFQGNYTDEIRRTIDDHFDSVISKKAMTSDYVQQVEYLTTQNVRLTGELNALEKQLNEVKEIGLQQQNQLLQLEKQTSDDITGLNTGRMSSPTFRTQERCEKIEIIAERLNKSETQLLHFKEVNTKQSDALKSFYFKTKKLLNVVSCIKQEKHETLVAFKSYIHQVDIWKNQLSASIEHIICYIHAMVNENSEIKQECCQLNDTVCKLNAQLESHKTDDEKSEECIQTQMLHRQVSKLKCENEHLCHLNVQHSEEISCLNASLIPCKLNEETTIVEMKSLIGMNTAALEKNTNNVSSAVIRTQIDNTDDNTNDYLEIIANLKRENSELLTEMNDMNHVLKQRGETMSQQQLHCEVMLKKLYICEAQIHRNSDVLIEKEKELDLLRLRFEELDSYKQPATKITSSGDDELKCPEIVEGFGEQQNEKMHIFSMKLNARVKQLTQQIQSLESDKSKLLLELENFTNLNAALRKQLDTDQEHKVTVEKHLKSTQEHVNNISRDNDEKSSLINDLRQQVKDFVKDRERVEQWKKEIGCKVHKLRVELDAHKITKSSLEDRIKQMNHQLECKENSLKREIEAHNVTRSSMEQMCGERKKQSVLNLEIQDFERSVKELSTTLHNKNAENAHLNQQFHMQSRTIDDLKQENRLSGERVHELEQQLQSIVEELNTYRQQVRALEVIQLEKQNQILYAEQQLEKAHTENESVSLELSKSIGEHCQIIESLQNERDLLRNHLQSIQKCLRDTQNTVGLRETEIQTIRSSYDCYKVRAQSVLHKTCHKRDVVNEEKLKDELKMLQLKCETLTSHLNSCKLNLDRNQSKVAQLENDNRQKTDQIDGINGQLSVMKCNYEELVNKHQQSAVEHSEAIRTLKVRNETLAQCYRQQLNEQEMRYQHIIGELEQKHSKEYMSSVVGGVIYEMPPLSAREEGEGSESVLDSDPSVSALFNTQLERMPSSNKDMGTTISIIHPLPLERLLNTTDHQECGIVKQQLHDYEIKVHHLTALLSDTEQDLAKHVQMNKLLKDEIRRHQRSDEREKHAKNLEYLKNVVVKFATLECGDEKVHLVPVLNTILNLSPDERRQLNTVAKGESNLKEWATSYFTSWS